MERARNSRQTRSTTAIRMQATRIVTLGVAFGLTLIGAWHVGTPARADVNNFWGPAALSNPISSSCDVTWIHRQPTRVPPNQGFVITVTVPSSLILDTLKLSYSLNSGPTVTTLGVLPSTTIPGALLAEGTVVDYALQVTFHPSLGYTGSCTGFNAAQIPHSNGFRTVATSETSIGASPVADAAVYAVSALYGEPQFTSTTPASSVCTTYFSPPTPCELLTTLGQTSPNIPTPILAGSGTVTYSPATQGYPYYSCVAPSHWIDYFTNTYEHTTGSHVAAPSYFADEDANSGAVYLHTRATALGFSGEQFNAGAWAGFWVSFTPGFSGTVSLAYTVKGQRAAIAGASFPLAGSNATPKVFVYSWWEDKTSGAHGADTLEYAWPNNGISTQFGWSGLGTAGVNPFEDPRGKSDSVTWQDFSFTANHTYQFWVKLVQENEANAGSGGASADANNNDVVEGWTLAADSITVSPSSGTFKSQCPS